jgi:hypothetical protein
MALASAKFWREDMRLMAFWPVLIGQVASEPKGSRLQRTSTVAEVTTVATDEVGMVDTTQYVGQLCSSTYQYI